jgi:hypothetical protein
MCELLPDLVQQVPARGAISNMVAGQAALVTSGVELANNVSVVTQQTVNSKSYNYSPNYSNFPEVIRDTLRIM